MKKYIVTLSIFLVGIHSLLYCLQPQQPPQEYTFELKDEKETKITPQQMQDLLTISITLKEQFTDPQGAVVMPTDPVGLEEVPQADFKFIIKHLVPIKAEKAENPTVKNSLIKALQTALTKLNDNALGSLINSANFLDIPFLLETAIKIYAEKFVFNDAIIKKNFGLDESPEKGELAFNHYLENLSFSAEISNKIVLTQELPLGDSLLKKIHSVVLEKPRTISETEGAIFSLSWRGNQLARQERKLISQPGQPVIHASELVVWDMTTKKELYRIIQEGLNVRFSPDNTKFIRGIYLSEFQSIGFIQVIDWNTQSLIKEFRIGSFSAVWNSDSSKLAILDADKKSITIFDVITGKKLLTITRENEIKRFSLSENNIVIGLQDTIEILDQKTGNLLKPIDLSVKKPYTKDSIFSSQKSYGRLPQAICINTTSSLLAAILRINLNPSGEEHILKVVIYNMIANSIFHLGLPRESFAGFPTAITFSPDSTQLAIGFSSGALLIYTLPTYFTKVLKELSLAQAQLLSYMEQNNIHNFHQLPEYLWELFNSLPTEIKNLFIKETEVSAEEHEEAMDIVKEFETEEPEEEPAAKRQKTEEE